MEIQELTEIIDKILWGKSIVIVKDGIGKSHNLILRSLTSKENNIANYIYKRELELSKNEGLLSLDELKSLYEHQGIWGEKQLTILDNLHKQINILQADIKSAEFFHTKRKRLQKHLEAVRNKIRELNDRKGKLFAIAYENRAEEVKRRFLIMMSVEDMNENALWKSEEDFLNDADAILLYNLALAYYKNNVFPESKMREVARSVEWRYRWSVAKNGANLFGKPISDWSETQNALVYWSQYYDSIYESHDFPGEYVISNDEACDAWVREQNRSSRISKEINPTAPKKAKAKRTKVHQEQFLFVEPGDKEAIDHVKGMNTEKVRNQLQDEHEYIKKHGKVSEWKLRVARKRGEV